MKIVLLTVVAVSVFLTAQTQQPNPIVTAFPSLNIPSGARVLAMGDCGVAVAEGPEALYYNASRTAFAQHPQIRKHRARRTEWPWLRRDLDAHGAAA